MATKTTEMGREGENQAARFLQEKGYQIVTRNFRYKRCEIDIVAKKEELLVFIEVKMRSSLAFGYPEEAVDDAKADRILEAAAYYMEQNPDFGCARFDIISIQRKNNGFSIVHLEDAFF